MNSLVELQGVSKTYRRGAEEIWALNSVSLSLSEKSFTAVLGPSGSGKTTLLNILGCMDRPTEGTVRMDGEDITHWKDSQLTALRRTAIGFVFQQFFLVPTLTALENVELPAMFAGRGSARDRALELLDLVGLKSRMDHRPKELSGGEMQRVAVARALINNPKLLVADEPTGNLDSAKASSIFGLFQELNNQGLTIVVVTHNEELAAQAQTIARLKDGTIG